MVGEIATSNLVVALNKCDLLPSEDRPKAIKKAQRRLAQTFNMTKFAGAKMVPIVAKPGARAGAPRAGAAGGPLRVVHSTWLLLLCVVCAALRCMRAIPPLAAGPPRAALQGRPRLPSQARAWRS